MSIWCFRLNVLTQLKNTLTRAHVLNLHVCGIIQSFSSSYKSQLSAQVRWMCLTACLSLPIKYETGASVVVSEVMSHCVCVYLRNPPRLFFFCPWVLFSFSMCVFLWHIPSSSSIMKHNMVIQNPQVCVCVCSLCALTTVCFSMCEFRAMENDSISLRLRVDWGVSVLRCTEEG